MCRMNQIGSGRHLIGALHTDPVKPAQNTRKVASSTDPGPFRGALTTYIMLGTLRTTHTAATQAHAPSARVVACSDVDAQLFAGLFDMLEFLKLELMVDQLHCITPVQKRPGCKITATQPV